MSQAWTASRGSPSRSVRRSPSSSRPPRSDRPRSTRSQSSAARARPGRQPGVQGSGEEVGERPLASATSASAGYVAPIRSGAASIWTRRPGKRKEYWRVVSAPSSVPADSTTSDASSSTPKRRRRSSSRWRAGDLRGTRPAHVGRHDRGARASASGASSSAQPNAARRRRPRPPVASGRREQAGRLLELRFGRRAEGLGHPRVLHRRHAVSEGDVDGDLDEDRAQAASARSATPRRAPRGSRSCRAARAASLTTGGKEARWSGSSCR